MLQVEGYQQSSSRTIMLDCATILCVTHLSYFVAFLAHLHYFFYFFLMMLEEAPPGIFFLRKCNCKNMLNPHKQTRVMCWHKTQDIYMLVCKTQSEETGNCHHGHQFFFFKQKHSYPDRLATDDSKAKKKLAASMARR